jgi:hypothetical protein
MIAPTNHHAISFSKCDLPWFVRGRWTSLETPDMLARLEVVEVESAHAIVDYKLTFASADSSVSSSPK